MSEPITITAAGISAKTFLIHGLAAFFGALAHALNAHRRGESKTILDFTSLLLISSFTGSMFFLLGFHFLGRDSYFTIVLGGSGGWLGVEGMALLVSFIKTSIRANFSDAKDRRL